MQAEARVGLISAAEGSVNPLRASTEGALVVAHGGGKYSEATLQGRVYAASNQAATDLSLDNDPAFLGLVLSNPATSGKNYALLGFGFGYAVACSTATFIGLATGTDAGDAAAVIAPRNRKVGGPSSSALVDDDCTLVGVPVLEQVFAQAATSTTASPACGGPTYFDLDGSLIIPPGSYVCTWSFAADAAETIICSFLWEEIPV